MVFTRGKSHFCPEAVQVLGVTLNVCCVLFFLLLLLLLPPPPWWLCYMSGFVRGLWVDAYCRVVCVSVPHPLKCCSLVAGLRCPRAARHSTAWCKWRALCKWFNIFVTSVLGSHAPPTYFIPLLRFQPPMLDGCLHTSSIFSSSPSSLLWLNPFIFILTVFFPSSP